MTTIVFRDGILAADTRAFSGSPRPIGTKRKIHLTKYGTAFGVSTSKPGLSEDIANWFFSEKERDHEPVLGENGFEALEITADGEVYYYNDSFIPSGPLEAPFWAIGSGAEYALGAMACGADALGAVTVAREFDMWTDGELMAIQVGPQPLQVTKD